MIAKGFINGLNRLKMKSNYKSLKRKVHKNKKMLLPIQLMMKVHNK